MKKIRVLNKTYNKSINCLFYCCHSHQGHFSVFPEEQKKKKKVPLITTQQNITQTKQHLAMKMKSQNL